MSAILPTHTQKTEETSTVIMPTMTTCISACIPTIYLLNIYQSEECVQHDIEKAACQTLFFCNCEIFIIINQRGFLRFPFLGGRGGYDATSLSNQFPSFRAHYNVE